MAGPDYVWADSFPDFHVATAMQMQNMAPPGAHMAAADAQPFTSSRNVSSALYHAPQPAHGPARAPHGSGLGTGSAAMKHHQPPAQTQTQTPFTNSAAAQLQFHSAIDIHAHNFQDYACSTAEHCHVSPPCDRDDCDEAAICYDHHSLGCMDSAYCNDPFHCDDTFACHDATCPVDLACDAICAGICDPTGCLQEHSQHCDTSCASVPCSDPECHEETLYCCLSDICPHKAHSDCHDSCLSHPPHLPHSLHVCHDPAHSSAATLSLHDNSSQSTLSTPQTSPADSVPTPTATGFQLQTLLEAAHKTFLSPNSARDWQSIRSDDITKPRKRRRVEAPSKPDANDGLEQDLYAIFPELANQSTWSDDCGFGAATGFTAAAAHRETRPSSVSHPPTSHPRETSFTAKSSMAPPYICQWQHESTGVCNTSFVSCEDLHEHVKEHTGRLVGGNRGANREYRCCWIGCDKTEPFGTKNHLDRHIQNHTGFKPFACTICGHRCVTQQQLNNHLTTHTRSKPFSCDFPGCTKTFSVKTALSTHKRTHTNEKPFHCRFCGDSYSDSSNLSKHRKTVHEDASTAIPCPEQGCEYKDSRQQRLERHCREQGHGGELVGDAHRWAEYTATWKRKPPRSRTASVARSSVSER
ncbi:hypothetical protein MBLNU459_g6956t1 [Dothideomycetes sp. NU459]